MQLVAEAQDQKSPTQRFTETFAHRFVPAVLIGTLLVIIILPLAFSWTWSASFYRGMLLLVAASPCALALGTPAAVFAGIAQAARRGVMIKDGIHLENLGHLKTVALDKTGTLTTGRFAVTKITAFEGTSEDEVLRIAAAVEEQSTHPLAVAIVKTARERNIAAPEELRAVHKPLQPLSVHLGTLGMTGMTAWAGLTMVEVKEGDVIYISGAAGAAGAVGAVGNMAGQLAKLQGCRVIGSAGSDDKVKRLLNECGFDVAFNYKTAPVLEQLTLAAPDGIDVYFDNVGGESLEVALTALRAHGRIIACGGISGYNEEKPKPGPPNLFNMTTKRLTMKGLIVHDWLDRHHEFEEEVAPYFESGKLKNLETVVEGLDQAVAAFIGLFEGKNVGKMIVKLVP